MIRTIVSRKYYRTSSHPRNAKDSVRVTLTCGCEKRYKGSEEPKRKAFCNCTFQEQKEIPWPEGPS